MTRWRETIDLNGLLDQDDEAPGFVFDFEGTRDKIVERVKASEWYTHADEDGQLHDTVDWMAYADTEREFASYLQDLYDLADDDHVWLDAFGMAR